MTIRGILRPAVLLFLICAAISPAGAQMRPRLVPARDVTVDYTVTPTGRAPIDVRVEILAGGQRLRVTSADLPTTLLVNRSTETAAILVPMLRAYSEVQIGRYDPESTMLRGAQFTPAGRARLAGRVCNMWRAHSAEGAGDACVTDDGVILQGQATSFRHGRLGIIQARRVAYGAPPPALFEIPADFQPSPIRLDTMGLATMGLAQ